MKLNQKRRSKDQNLLIWGFVCQEPEPYDAVTVVTGSLDHCLKYLLSHDIFPDCEEEFNKLYSTAAIPMLVEFLYVSRSGDSAGAKTWIATRFCLQSQKKELCQ